jgi:chaperonin cofactor prefoldin
VKPLYIILLVLFTNSLLIGGVYLWLNKPVDSVAKQSATPTQTPTLQPSPTPEPTNTPRPTIKPVSEAQTMLKKRLSEIDSQIASLNQQKADIKTRYDNHQNSLNTGDLPAGVNPLTVYDTQSRYLDELLNKAKEINEKITTLNSERTQILINLGE